jgi:hypothetical protein
MSKSFDAECTPQTAKISARISSENILQLQGVGFNQGFNIGNKKREL